MLKNKLFKLGIAIFLYISIVFSGSMCSKAILPKTLSNFRNFYVIKDLEVKRSGRYTPEEISTIETFLKEIIDKNDFSMAVHLDCLNKIIDDDIFKSSVERFWSPFKDLKFDEENISRRYTTSEFFNIDASELEGKDYEKYGYLSCKDKRQDFLDADHILEYYGNVIVNFKKANLIHRTTLTVGDSLNKRHYFGKNSVTPTLTDDPRLVCISGYSKAYIDLFLSLIRSEKLLLSRPNLISRLTGVKCYDSPYFEYFELQFHGELSFSNDVESVDILRKSDDNASAREKQDALKKRIEASGITCNIIEL